MGPPDVSADRPPSQVCLETREQFVSNQLLSMRITYMLRNILECSWPAAWMYYTLEKMISVSDLLATKSFAKGMEFTAHCIAHIVNAERSALERLQWTLVDLSFLQPVVDTVMYAVGMTDSASVKFALSLALGYPLVFLVPFMPEFLRQPWLVVSGLLLYQWVFGIGYLRVLLVASGCFAVLKAGTVNKAIGRWSPVATAILSFAYLCIRHASRQDGASITDAVPMMVLAVKLYTFGYNVYDGTIGLPALAQSVSETLIKLRQAKTPEEMKRIKASHAILEDRYERSVREFPSLLDFLSFIFNPATVMAGPAYEYSVHRAGITHKARATVATGKSTESVLLPIGLSSRWLPSLLKFLVGAFCLLTSAIFTPAFNIEGMHQQSLAVLAGDATAPSTAARLWYMYIAFLLVRMQYYGVWKLTEGAAVLGGFGYRPTSAGNQLIQKMDWLLGGSLRSILSLNGFISDRWLDSTLALFNAYLPQPGSSEMTPTPSDDLPDWEAASNIDPLSVETATSIDTMLKHWNKHTQSWLERYIFKRAPRAGGLNKWLAFGASAFWHGFYPGYYLGFLTIPLIQEGGKQLHNAWLRVLAVTGVLKPAQAFADTQLGAVMLGLGGWIFTMGAWSYCLMPFCIFEAQKGLEMWKSWWYIGHLFIASSFILSWATFALLGSGKASSGAGKVKAS